MHFLILGDTDGNIIVWNLGNELVMHGDNGPLLPDFTFYAHKDCSNGVRLVCILNYITFLHCLIKGF